MVKKINEGLADMAQKTEMDHEVQMARSDLYKIAKYAMKLHDMLKGVSEAEGIEGWQQAKITKAADYLGSVYHSLDYEMTFTESINEKYKSPEEKKMDRINKKLVRYKKQENNESLDPYILGLRSRLSSVISESTGVCKECGKPSYTTLPEEKQKGVDGKVCWKGYRRMGTKQKGGKTVDNCVKVGS